MKKLIRILHLEDNPADAELIRMAIEDCLQNIEIDLVDSKKDYVENIEKGDYDLIISDYQVPGFDGTESIEIAREKDKYVPFIYITGALGEELAVELLRAGATDYMLKGNLEKIEFIIRRAIRESNQEKEKTRLLESLRQRNQIINSTKQSILIAEKKEGEYYIDYTNEHAVEKLGAEGKVMLGEELVHFFKRVCGKDFSLFLKKSLKNEKNVSEEVPCVKSNGSRFWLDVSVSMIELEANSVSYCMVILKDVTEKKILQNEILNAYKLFEEAQNIAKIGLWEMDPKNNSISFTKEAGYILNATEKTVLNFENFADFLYSTDDTKEKLLSRLKNNEEADFDIQIRTITEDYKWIRILSYPVYDDEKLAGMRGLVMDIDGRKKAEMRAHKNQLLSELVFNTVNDMICLHKFDGSFTRVSPSVVKITGYKPKELLGKKYTDFVHPEDLAQRFSKRGYPYTYLDGKNADVEYRFRKKNGEYIWLMTNIVAVDDATEGGETVVVSSTRDITEKKQKELELQKEHEEALKSQLLLLSTQINPHFFFNSLNAIQYYILENNEEEALNFVSNFSTLMRSVLSNSMQSYIPLEEELIWIESYIKLEQNRFTNKFDYEIIKDPNMDLTQIYIPTMLLQPFIENSIVHGIAPLKIKGHIKISFKKGDSGQVFCRIEDNGIGRTTALKNKSLRGADGKRKSFGVGITNRKIEILNELRGGHFSYEVKDKFDQEGNSEGTIVMLSFPENLKENNLEI